ncbi:unnamed protein product [Vitrella brassicaformis CCMP3155]|uniref:Uncharacterized protein n=1 Tax=Vitrella brassicaformis (strain CCMP3155) TaxID=1169540 RepID=A0A0G4FMN1_VITBC|nr:unnamed protein product [Vitrella brassicaformis CCMP3155]|eukprot:CEM14833.1 unnamed protein product [Vitrella brassicaformis CCMP3155]
MLAFLQQCAIFSCTLVGSIVLIRWFLFTAVPSLMALSTPKRKLRSLGEWAVVTGATDGIGRAMAIEIARKGLNVLLMARNEEKLTDTKTEIESLPGFKGKGEVRTVQVDFSGQPSSGLYATIEQAIRGLDIGVLVNNVGLSYPHAMFYNEVESSFVDTLIEVNVRSALRLTHLIYPGMVERKRGAIVMVGSAGSKLPSYPLYAAYAATKACSDAFAQALQAECEHKNIIVQCHVPLLVQTKMAKIRKASLTVPSPERYAKSAISAVENGDSQTQPTLSPYLWHQVMFSIIGLFPYSLWTKYQLPQNMKIRSKALKKKAEEETNKKA